MGNIGVIGGGPAGMFSAIIAAGNGHQVTLYEKNEKLGKKLYITGKGRCNLTNTADEEELFRNIPHNANFMRSGFARFGSADLMQWFENAGVPLQVERGNRVFPVSNKASDITRALIRALEKQKVTVRLQSKVTGICVQEGRVTGIEAGGFQPHDAVILATGGASYPVTGSTGDGYTFAQKLGHKVLPPSPVLIGLKASDNWISQVEGLSLRNVTLFAQEGKKQIFNELGEMLFTHDGITGPLVLTLSSILQGRALENISCHIDLKPGLSPELLDKRILRDFEEISKKMFRNALDALLPSSLIPVMITLSGIDSSKQISQISKVERLRLVELLKALPLHISGFGPMSEAVVTRGGVAVSEIRPATMESKLVQGLYFAGEVIDVDGFTGGFNLQIAFTTAYVAADSVN